MEKIFYTITELATLMGISRIAVFNQVKLGKIYAIRVGNSYVIPSEEAEKAITLRKTAQKLGRESLSVQQRRKIDAGVDKAVDQYSDVLERLGKD